MSRLSKLDKDFFLKKIRFWFILFRSLLKHSVLLKSRFIVCLVFWLRQALNLNFKVLTDLHLFLCLMECQRWLLCARAIMSEPPTHLAYTICDPPITPVRAPCISYFYSWPGRAEPRKILTCHMKKINIGSYSHQQIVQTLYSGIYS